MNAEKTLEVYGILEKIEGLTTLSKNCLSGSLVFESRSPFWGYYNETPHDYVPIYIYLVLDRNYSVFDIAHASKCVRQELNIQLDAAKTEIVIHDKHYHTLRLRHIGSYDSVSTIQEAYQKCGIKPLMAHVAWAKETAHMTFEKIFHLNSNEDQFYIDISENNHFYFELPEHIAFAEFEQLTQKVRNNWMGTKFDAAIGRFLKRDRAVDFVRIYSEKISSAEIIELKNLYFSRI
jgi:hypothetical protein